jgi:hypothetical protein
MHDYVSFINTYIQYLVCLLHLLITSDQECSFITYGLIISCGETLVSVTLKMLHWLPQGEPAILWGTSLHERQW